MGRSQSLSLTQCELLLSRPQLVQHLLVALLQGGDVGVLEGRGVLLALLELPQRPQPLRQEVHLGLQGQQAGQLLLWVEEEEEEEEVVVEEEVGRGGS